MNEWLHIELDLLTKHYGQVKITELEKLLPNRSRGAIQKRANLLKLRGNNRLAQKLYSYDNKFFDTPNIQNCYWAGFIAADGCVCEKDTYLGFSIGKKDEEILYNFKQQVLYDGPIRYYTLDNHQYVDLRMYSMHHWHNKLREYWNITPKKSNTLRPPNLINKQHIYAYIIGYFDGDGTMGWYKNDKYFAFGFCGTQIMMEWIRGQLADTKLSSHTTQNAIHKNGISNTNKIVIWTGKNAIHMHQLLLNTVDIPWRLKRKWPTIDSIGIKDDETK